MPTFGIYERRGLVSRSWLVCLALSGVLVLAVVCADADGPPAGMSSEAWAGIQEQLEVERHQVSESNRPGRLWRADNPVQRFTAHFGSEDVALYPRGGGEPAWELGLRLTSWGVAHDLQQVNFATATAYDNRVEYRRGPLTEWYVNTTMGLEQGFTIEAPPADDITELVLEMTLDGNLTAEIAGNAGAVTFRREDSNVMITYSGLKAWDAVAQPLEARLELANGAGTLRLVISVSDAAWPITVDPIFTQVAKLLPVGDPDSAGVAFGISMAERDGLVVIGTAESLQGGWSGTAYVFQAVADGLEFVAKLAPADGGPGSEFGRSVAVNGDTVIVCARYEDNGSGPGSAYVFDRDQGGTDAWGQVTKIVPAGVSEADEFGLSVAISGDTAVFGAPGNESEKGAVYIFGRDQGGQDGWGQVKKLTLLDGSTGDDFGQSLSMSGDTLLVGADGYDGPGLDFGAAFVFERNAGGPDNWGQTAMLSADDGEEEDHFGVAVATDGTRAVISAPGTFPERLYVFERDPGGSGSWEQASVVNANLASNFVFGQVLAINGDTIVAGDRLAFNQFDQLMGAAHVFERDSGGTGEWGLTTTLRAFDGNEYDNFGRSVLINGDRVYVAAHAHEHSGLGNTAGAVFIYERHAGGPDTWGLIEEAVSPPVSVAYWEFFGIGAVSGDNAVIGAYADDDAGYQSGSAYFFRRNEHDVSSWDLLHKVVLPDGEEGDGFGGAMSIDGDTAIVSARGDNINGLDSGAAYVFRRDQGGANAWGHVATITPSDGGPSEWFGGGVSLSGDTAIIGAVGDDPNGLNSGSAYVFRHEPGDLTTWNQIAKIIPDDGSEGDRFGSELSISGDTAVVGVQLDDVNGIDSGSAYVFQRDAGGPDSWGEVIKIVPTGGVDNDRFGKAVSIDADTIVVGTHLGAFTVHHRDQGGPDAWGVAGTIPNPGADWGGFGSDAALDGNTLLIGAYYADGQLPDSGLVYVFRRDQGGPDGWGLVATISAADGGTDDRFGDRVSLSGDTALISATEHDCVGWNSGAAYIITISDAFFADGFETGDTSAWSATVP